MEKIIRNILGPTIKFHRKNRNMTQEYLAQCLNNQGLKLDRPMLTKIENQTREIYDYEICAIAKVFEIDYNDLFKVTK
ncbi:helix-turn-helix domain-containing protein [Clostridium sp.]|uniref:helix-turn-helix domain-containing protein n=1 Tax=Clostridium sp. TaxID=1506 RepID=UPI003D6D3584